MFYLLGNGLEDNNIKRRYGIDRTCFTSYDEHAIVLFVNRV